MFILYKYVLSLYVLNNFGQLAQSKENKKVQVQT